MSSLLRLGWLPTKELIILLKFSLNDVSVFFLLFLIVDKYHYIVYTLTCGSLEDITQFQTRMSKIHTCFQT